VLVRLLFTIWILNSSIFSFVSLAGSAVSFVVGWTVCFMIMSDLLLQIGK